MRGSKTYSVGLFLLDAESPIARSAGRASYAALICKRILINEEAHWVCQFKSKVVNVNCIISRIDHIIDASSCQCCETIWSIRLAKQQPQQKVVTERLAISFATWMSHARMSPGPVSLTDTVYFSPYIESNAYGILKQATVAYGILKQATVAYSSLFSNCYSHSNPTFRHT